MDDPLPVSCDFCALKTHFALFARPTTIPREESESQYVGNEKTNLILYLVYTVSGRKKSPAGGSARARRIYASVPRSAADGTSARTISRYFRISASDGAWNPSKGTVSRSVNFCR